jgi:hypothetical protein
VCFWKSIEVKWLTVARSQFTLQGSGNDSFVIGKEFPYLPLNLRCGIHK